jgi:hypothetical protein
VINDIFAHEDWLTTVMAAVGEPQTADKLKRGETRQKPGSFNLSHVMEQLTNPRGSN